jgi:hypothetical protein
MTAQELTPRDVVTLGDVKQLAASRGPCLTIVAPIANPAELQTRLKNVVRGVQKLTDRGGAGSEITEALLDPINEVAAAVEAKRIWANSLVLFRSPEVFTYYIFHDRWKDSLIVADRFQIRPLLSALAREQRFHLLGLSRRRIRLLRCTQHSMEETSLEGAAPQDMRLWMNTRIPDHVLDNRSSAGSSVGSMKGVLFGTSTDRDREYEYLSHFFKEVDKGVHSILRNDTAPLVLAGVEDEVAIYRRVNTHPRLLEKAVLGSPDGLAGQVLHARAREIVAQTFSEPLRKVLAELPKQRDRGHVLFDVEGVARAAHEGRISDLLISANTANADVEEDCLNTAALKTVRYGGRAFALGPQEMPEKAEVVAILRFLASLSIVR